MDLTAIIAGTTLLVASSNQAPLHEFSYSYYDENSIIQTEEGTGFYRPKFPELTLEGLTHIENTGLIWSVTTPYVSSKYERGFNVEATIYRDFITGPSTRIRLSTTVASLAKEVISASYKQLASSRNSSISSAIATTINSEYFKIANLENDMPYHIYIIDPPHSSEYPISPNFIAIIFSNLIKPFNSIK